MTEIHIGVGFCVARSDSNGQCEGLRVLDGQLVKDSHALFVCSRIFVLILSLPGLWGSFWVEENGVMKTMIVISATSNKGKTETIVKASRILSTSEWEYFQYGTDDPIAEPDDSWALCRGECVVGKKRGIVAFSSEGDTAWSVEKGLDAVTGKGKIYPDVIVLACRTKGGSRKAVSDFATKHGYDQVWTSTCYGIASTGECRPTQPNGLNLNEAFAQCLVELIKSIL